MIADHKQALSMSQFSQLTKLVLLLVVHSTIAADTVNFTVDLMDIPGNSQTCPSQVRREAAILNIRASVQAAVDVINPICGSGL